MYPREGIPKYMLCYSVNELQVVTIFCNAALILKLSVGKRDVQFMLPLNNKIKIFIMAALDSIWRRTSLRVLLGDFQNYKHVMTQKERSYPKTS